MRVCDSVPDLELTLEERRKGSETQFLGPQQAEHKHCRVPGKADKSGWEPGAGQLQQADRRKVCKWMFLQADGLRGR